MKPVDPILLQEAVRRVKPTEEVQLDQLKAHLYGQSGKITLNSQDKLQLIDIDQIIRCESTGAYTFFHTLSGEEILVTRTLKDYERILADRGFLRVHQSHLVNIQFIREFVKSDGGYLVLTNHQQIPVSSRKKSTVLSVLSAMG